MSMRHIREGLFGTPLSRWELNNSEGKPSFLPTNLDKSNLIDITTMTDMYRRYIDTKTGKLHVGDDYYKQYTDEVENENRQK